jgi:hypothetical protein
MKKQRTFRQVITEFFTQTLKHNWYNYLLALLAGFMVVMLIAYVG